MNFPTAPAKQAILALPDNDLKGWHMRSVHSDGSVSFYWKDGRKVHVTAAGVVERTRPERDVSATAEYADPGNDPLGGEDDFDRGEA